MKFLKNERGIIIKDCLVISDLHIGYEKVLEEKGYRIPKVVNNYIKRLKKIKENENVKKLIILGDVKHEVKGIELEELFDLIKFMKEIKKIFEEIVIIKGNHDGRIERIAKKYKIDIFPEYKIGNYGLIHGHKYPSEELMKCKFLIVGHMHPTYKIKDKSGITHYYPCFIIGKLKKEKLKRYKKINVEKVIVIPTFNKFLSGYIHPTGPILKALKIEKKILLDLTVI